MKLNLTLSDATPRIVVFGAAQRKKRKIRFVLSNLRCSQTIQNKPGFIHVYSVFNLLSVGCICTLYTILSVDASLCVDNFCFVICRQNTRFYILLPPPKSN